jgi:hypothetical protein
MSGVARVFVTVDGRGGCWVGGHGFWPDQVIVQRRRLGNFLNLVQVISRCDEQSGVIAYYDWQCTC